MRVSLQAHTDVAASPSVADRVAIPELSDKLYHQLVKIAARYAIPMDELAEYILRSPESAPRSVGDLAAAKRAERSEREAENTRLAREARRAATCVAGHASCPTAFVYKGLVRCGCPKPSAKSWADL